MFPSNFLTPFHVTLRQLLNSIDSFFKSDQQQLKLIKKILGMSRLLTHRGTVNTLDNADEYELPIIRPTINTETRKSIIETCLKLIINFLQWIFHYQLALLKIVLLQFHWLQYKNAENIEENLRNIFVGVFLRFLKTLQYFVENYACAIRQENSEP